jgi:hypothetical protein
LPRARATIKIGLLTIDSGPSPPTELIKQAATTGVEMLNAEAAVPSGASSSS